MYETKANFLFLFFDQADFESSTKSTEAQYENLHDGNDLNATKIRGFDKNPEEEETVKNQITEYHILKIAAELLLDFC